MDDNLPTEFDLIVVGTGETYTISNSRLQMNFVSMIEFNETQCFIISLDDS